MPSEVDPSDAGSRFRFGPLAWRTSRERNNKKACPNKAARNAKCNSGDSGVQVRLLCLISSPNAFSHNRGKKNEITHFFTARALIRPLGLPPNSTVARVSTIMLPSAHFHRWRHLRSPSFHISCISKSSP